MVLTFEMPGDQDWDNELWQRIGVGPEWERLGRAFSNLGVEVNDTEEVVLEFPDKNETKVRKVLEAARAGSYGPDVRTYWSAATEVETDEDD